MGFLDRFRKQHDDPQPRHGPPGPTRFRPAELAAAGAPLEEQREAVLDYLAAAGMPEASRPLVLAEMIDGVMLQEDGDAQRPSRIGGPGVLPEGVAWPTGPTGTPFSFLARVDLADVPHLEPLPRDGELLLFWGEDNHEWEHMDFVRAAAVFHVRPGEPTVEQENPDPRLRCAPIPLTGMLMPVLPGLDHARFEEPVVDASYHHSLLGRSRDIQGPVLEEIHHWFRDVFPETLERYSEAERRGEGWTLLAQIDSTGDFMFGDLGSVYFVVPEADLRAGRFDRVMGIMQCS